MNKLERIEEMEKQLATLRAEVEQEQKPKKWEPKGGNWVANSWRDNATYHEHPILTSDGDGRETKEAAEKAARVKSKDQPDKSEWKKKSRLSRNGKGKRKTWCENCCRKGHDTEDCWWTKRNKETAKPFKKKHGFTQNRRKSRTNRSCRS